MSKEIESLGVIGAGRMIEVVTHQLTKPGIDIVVNDKDPNAVIPEMENVRRGDLELALGQDAVCLAVPYRSLRELMPYLRELPDDTLIYDICSVKFRVEEIFRRNGLLEHENFALAHPLFGPDSLKKVGYDPTGMVVAVTLRHGERAKELFGWWKANGIDIDFGMTSDEHDQEAGDVQGKPTFFGRLINRVGLRESRFSTPYNDVLKDLATIDAKSSEALFKSIEQDNSYVEEGRLQLVVEAVLLHTQLALSTEIDDNTPLTQLAEVRKRKLAVVERGLVMMEGLWQMAHVEYEKVRLAAGLPPDDSKIEKELRDWVRQLAPEQRVDTETALKVRKRLFRTLNRNGTVHPQPELPAA